MCAALPVVTLWVCLALWIASAVLFVVSLVTLRRTRRLWERVRYFEYES